MAPEPPNNHPQASSSITENLDPHSTTPFLIRLLRARHVFRFSLDLAQDFIRRLRHRQESEQSPLPTCSSSSPSHPMPDEGLGPSRIQNAELGENRARPRGRGRERGRGRAMTGTVRGQDDTSTPSSTDIIPSPGIPNPSQKEPSTEEEQSPVPQTPVPQPLDIPRRPPSPLSLPGPTLTHTSTSPDESSETNSNNNSNNNKGPNANKDEPEVIALHPSRLQPITLLVPAADLRVVTADLEGRNVDGAVAAEERVKERWLGVPRARCKRAREEEDKAGVKAGREKGKGRGGDGKDKDRNKGLLNERWARVIAEREDERRKKRIRMERARMRARSAVPERVYSRPCR